MSFLFDNTSTSEPESDSSSSNEQEQQQPESMPPPSPVKKVKQPRGMTKAEMLLILAQKENEKLKDELRTEREEKHRKSMEDKLRRIEERMERLALHNNTVPVPKKKGLKTIPEEKEIAPIGSEIKQMTLHNTPSASTSSLESADTEEPPAAEEESVPVVPEKKPDTSMED